MRTWISPGAKQPLRGELQQGRGRCRKPVARTASEVETLTAKNQHQQQIEKDAARVVALAQARFRAGIIAGSRVSEAKFRRSKSVLPG